MPADPTRPNDGADTPGPQHRVERKRHIASKLDALVSDIKALKGDLYQITLIEPDDDGRAELAELLRMEIDLIDAQFAYLSRLLDRTADDLFAFDFDASQPESTIAATIDRAHEEFIEVLAPVPDAIADGTLDDTEWRRYYGYGFGHSYSAALSYVARRAMIEVGE